MRRLLTSLFLALGIAAPAFATPPGVITIEDQPFGLSETELLVLRTTWDNLGSHYDSHYETLLVAISLETGEQTYWPVDSVAITTEFGAAGEDDRRVLKRPGLDGRVDPFAILAERGAVAWAVVSSVERRGTGAMVAQTANSVTVTYPERFSVTLPKAKALAHMTASMTQTGEHVSDYARRDPVSAREQFAMRQIDPATCRYDAGDLAHFPSGTRMLQLVRVTCSDEEDLDSNALLVPVVAAG